MQQVKNVSWYLVRTASQLRQSS